VPYHETVRREAVLGAAVAGAVALCGCDDVFGLTRHVDAAIDTPIDSALGGPDAPADAVDGRPDAAIDAAIDAPPGAVCPATYGIVDVILPSRYRFLTVPRSWPNAQAACAADQIAGSTRFTHLVVIDDDTERSRLNAQQPNMRAWIGATDRVTEGTFRWIAAGGAVLPPTGSPWAAGEPTGDQNPADDCVEMGNTADYSDSDCGALLVVWCECDANPVIPGSF
jgi:hypothetical protein